MKKCLSIYCIESIASIYQQYGSVFSSSNTECIACTVASQPASYPAQTWSYPTDEKTSSRSADTITCPVIRRGPRYLSNGFNLTAKNDSKFLC